MKTRSWLLAGAVLLAGCSSMMSDADRIRSMIDDVRRENEMHDTAAAGARSMAEMRDEMLRHRAAMGEMTVDMRDAMDGMTGCSGTGMGELTDMHGAMGAEMTIHDDAMATATTLDVAAGEVHRHVDAMSGMLDDMDAATGHMGCAM